MPVQFLFSKASLAPGQLPLCDLSSFVINHSFLIIGKIDQGVVNNWGFQKSPSCMELQLMDFKNKLAQSGRYLLVQEVTQREFTWIHPKWIGQKSRNSVTAKVSHQQSPAVPWPGVCFGAALKHFSSRMAFLSISFPSRLHTMLGALPTALEETVCLNNLIKEEQRDSFPLLFQQKKRGACLTIYCWAPFVFLTRPALKMEVKIPEISFD